MAYSPVGVVDKNIWDFDPRIIPGCTLWLDAADSNTISRTGTLISQWRDKSNNAALFNPASGGVFGSPNTSTANGYVSVFISGAAASSVVTRDQALTSTTSIPYLTAVPGQQFAGFIVVTFTATSVNNILFDITTGLFNVGSYNEFNVVMNSEQIVSGQSYGSLSSSRVMLGFTWNPTLASGNRVATYYSGTAGSVGGTGAATSFTGRLRLNPAITSISGNQNLHYHEVLLYSGPLSTSDRQQIEGYLGWKWGLQGGGTAPVISLPTTHPYRNTYSVVRPMLRPFVPTDVSNRCVLWFDAADINTLTLSGSTVSAWRDKSENANNIDSFLTPSPTYNPSTGFITFTSTPSTASTGTGTTKFNISLTSNSSYSIFCAMTFPASLENDGSFVGFRPFFQSPAPLYFLGLNRQNTGPAITTATPSGGSNTVYNVPTTSGFTNGASVRVAGIPVGAGSSGFNGTGTIQTIVLNTSITVNIASTGTVTIPANSGRIFLTSATTPHYLEANGGSGPFYFPSGNAQSFNTFSGNTFIISTTQTGSNAHTLSVNGNIGTSTGSTTMATRPVVVGTITASNLAQVGNITAGLGELLFYDGAVSTQDRRRIEGYLIWKWGAQRTAYPPASPAVGMNFQPSHPMYRFPPATVVPFRPSVITGLSVWIDAADTTSFTQSGGFVSQLTNKSTGTNLNPTSSAFQYLQTFNTKYPAFFGASTGGSGVLGTISSFTLLNPSTVFAVFQNTGDSSSTNTYPYLFDITASSGNRAYATWVNQGSNKTSLQIRTGSGAGILPGVETNNIQVLSMQMGTGATQTYTNGTIAPNSTISGATVASSTLTIGGNAAANALTGFLAEFIIYNAALTASQRQQVEGYLAWKWGLNASLPTTHPYYKVPT